MAQVAVGPVLGRLIAVGGVDITSDVIGSSQVPFATFNALGSSAELFTNQFGVTIHQHGHIPGMEYPIARSPVRCSNKS